MVPYPLLFNSLFSVFTTFRSHHSSMSAASAAAAAAAAISSSYCPSNSSNTNSDQYQVYQQFSSPNFGDSYSFFTTNQLFSLGRFRDNGAAPAVSAPEARTVSTPPTVKSAHVVDLDDQTLRCQKEESKAGRWRKAMNRCVMWLRWKNVKRMGLKKVVVKRQG